MIARVAWAVGSVVPVGSNDPMNAAKAISESSRPSSMGRGCGALFGGVFFVMGAAFLWLMLLGPVLKYYQARAWQTTNAEITFSEVHESRSSDSHNYRPDIHFKYQVSGREFVSETYSFETMSSSGKKWASEIVTKHPVGSEHPCFYNPGKPGEAVLIRDLPHWSVFAFSLLPLLFVGIGGGIIFSSLRGEKKPSKDFIANAIQDSVGTTSAPWIGNEGSRKLKPETSRMSNVIFFAIFGLIWNGITWLIVYTVIRDDGLFSFPMLIISLFVVIGLGLVLGFIYQLMALTNPVVEVAFSEAAVPIGESVDIAWELTGNVSRLSELELAVVGYESATYRRGTDTVTDIAEFERVRIASASKAEDIRFGSTTIQIPAGTMHSFQGKNNKVVWKVEVKGVIHRWPDINDNYTFFVKPNSVWSRS